MDPLGTDSCRVTFSMKLPVPNGSMQHREPKSEIDDTGHFLQGASCTIAAALHWLRWMAIRNKGSVKTLCSLQ
jgi:hypothetical protein